MRDACRAQVAELKTETRDIEMKGSLIISTPEDLLKYIRPGQRPCLEFLCRSPAISTRGSELCCAALDWDSPPGPGGELDAARRRVGLDVAAISIPAVAVMSTGIPAYALTWGDVRDEGISSHLDVLISTS